MAGAGVARDLALRGASVALFEKGDFASGTSSKSSKLIHGGLRYLELGDFELVRESLRERKTLRAPRPAPGAPAARSWCRCTGAPRAASSRCASACGSTTCSPPARRRERYRVLRPVDALSHGAELAGRGPARGRLLLRRPAALPRAPLPRERALGGAPRGADPQLLPGRGDHPGRARASTGVRVRDLLSDQVRRSGARRRRQRDGALGGPAARARGRGRPSPRMLRTTKGIHCLLPRITDRAIYLSTRRRADDLRHPVARLLAGRHHRHRLRRRSRPRSGPPARR